MPQRGEAGIFQAHGLLHQLFDGAALHMAIQARLMPHLAAKQFVDWNIEEFTFDVP